MFPLVTLSGATTENLPDCRDAVGVFYSLNQLGQRTNPGMNLSKRAAVRTLISHQKNRKSKTNKTRGTEREARIN